MHSLKIAGMMLAMLFFIAACSNSKDSAPQTGSTPKSNETTQQVKPKAVIDAPPDRPIANAPEETSIVIAADSSNLEGVMWFIQHGTPVDQTGEYGFTALQRAAAQGANDIVRYLLSKGANVHHINDDGFIALHTAAMSGDSMTISLLMDAGSLHYARDNNGLTPLHLSALKNNFSTAGELVRRGANINDKSESQWTPVRIAVYYKLPEMEKWLIAHGAKSEVMTETPKK